MAFVNLYLARKAIRFQNTDGFRWYYYEAPASLNVLGVPVSKHQFGVIATDRPLDHVQMNRAGVEPYGAPAERLAA